MDDEEAPPDEWDCSKCGQSVDLPYDYEKPDHGQCWECASSTVESLREEITTLRKENETLKQTVRLSWAWVKQPEHWRNARDVLYGQMCEMGEG